MFLFDHFPVFTNLDHYQKKKIIIIKRHHAEINEEFTGIITSHQRRRESKESGLAGLG